MKLEKISRRSFLKKSYRMIATFVWLSSFGYIYARYFEPKKLNVIHHTLKSAKIPKSFDGVRVVQFSDTHLGHHYSLKQLKEIVNEINTYNPDIILFTGDLMDAPNQYEYQDKLAPILRKLNAPLGKFCIYGNHDHGGYGSHDYKKIMENSDFQLLMNESVTVQNKTLDSITIAGLDDIILGKPDPEKTFENVKQKQYSILLVHEPDIVDQLKGYPFSLQLSGHSHGGQVKVPFFGPLITPPGAKRYHEGFYDITESAQLYVNRGLGTTRLPFRFLSQPELTVFTLQHEGTG